LTLERINQNQKEVEEDTMKKSRLIWGIVCMAIAAGLAVAVLTLPPDKISFQVEGENMPWVPVIVVGILGVWLFATAWTRVPAVDKKEVVVDPEKAALNKRLETMAWGCFLILLGGFMFIPDEIIRGGWWSVGVGLILLGLNAARYFYGLKMSGFTTFLGVLSLIGGTVEVIGQYNLDGAILLIVLGAYLLVKPYFDKRQLFGKAEEA
jgi:hypothetical protein